ncbi:MAG TPA: hypothetical protein VGF12_11900, partial [Roseateles sp.]|uniref:hypothetical protein n=1 Tax=Roseateles sp. TaxID=1971397 RepID=UPI002ED7F618
MSIKDLETRQERVFRCWADRSRNFRNSLSRNSARRRYLLPSAAVHAPGERFTAVGKQLGCIAELAP